MVNRKWLIYSKFNFLELFSVFYFLFSIFYFPFSIENTLFHKSSSRFLNYSQFLILSNQLIENTIDEDFTFR